MRRLETHPLTGFNETPVDPPASFVVETTGGDHLDYQAVISNTPAITSSYDGYYDSQLVLSNGEGLPGWDAELFPVGRLDDIHGRNLEVLANHIFIEDQYDNEYRSLCIKGSDFSNPHLFESATAERDFIIHGLQESLVMERVLRASRMLREHGISTEYICGLVVPKSFPLPNDETGFDDHISKDLPEFLEHLATQYAQDNAEREDKSPLELKAEMIDKFNDCDYLVSYRAMDCPYRFGELKSSQKMTSLLEFIRDTDRHEGEDSGEFSKDMDVGELTENYFVPTLALNLAKMHKLGLSHGFLHANNLTAFGSIVDLDSCKGEALGLGDEPRSEKDFCGDLLTALTAIRDTVIGSDIDIGSRLENSHHKQDKSHRASLFFLAMYLNERFDKASDKETCLETVLQQAGQSRSQRSPMFVRNIASIVYEAYSFLDLGKDASFNASYDHDAEEQTLNLSRQKSFLRTLPAFYFKNIDTYHTEHAESLVQENHGSVSEDTMLNLQHPVMGVIHDLCLRHIAKHCAPAQQQKELFLAAGYFTFSSRDVLQDLPAKTRAEEYFSRLKTRVIQRLAEPEEVDTTEIKSPIMKYMPDFLERLGYLDISAEDNELTPILYLETGEHYKAVFDALGINDDNIDIEPLDPHFVIDIMKQENGLAPDSLILADSRAAAWLAEQATRLDLIGSLFAEHRNIPLKPLIIISGQHTDKRRLYFWPERPIESLSLGQLREELGCPKDPEVKLPLF